jgi:hypothetical protein
MAERQFVVYFNSSCGIVNEIVEKLVSERLMENVQLQGLRNPEE